MLGLDLPLAETTRQLIDERLVKERNKIAHGEYLPIDHDSYNELHREIIKLLDIYSNEITNCAVAKKYLRSIDTK